MKFATFILMLLAMSLMVACGQLMPPLSDRTSASDGTTTTVPAPTELAAATTVPPETNATRTPAPPPKSSSNRTRQYITAPAMTIDPDATYTATIRTNRGNIEIALYASDTPITVNNFIFLANEGFYNGVLFHRVIPGFMIQGGDPTGTGAGGPGYRFNDEIVGSLLFDRAGLLAMANAGPGTNGSQFFITMGPTQHLTGNHTIFGEVVSGQDVANTISTVATGQRDRPTDAVIIETVEIIQAEQ